MRGHQRFGRLAIIIYSDVREDEPRYQAKLVPNGYTVSGRTLVPDFSSRVAAQQASTLCVADGPAVPR